MARKYPPAYYRYRERHPTLSVVLSDDLKDKLDSYRKRKGIDLSYADAIKMLLNEKKNCMKENIVFVCPRCNEKIIINEEDKNWKEVKAFLERGFFNVYTHRCQRKW